MRVLVLSNTTGLNDNMFNTGCTYFPTSFIKRFGICRVTSDNENGLLKTTTSLTALLCRESDKQDLIITSASAFKSGLNGVFFLTHNFNGSLNALSTDSAVAKLENNVIGEDFVVAGVTVKGFIVDVTLRISNAYSVEYYKQRTPKTVAEKSELESAIDLAEKYSNPEKVSFRDSVMKAAQSNVKFNMAATLMAERVKSNTTNVTHGEFQSVASWYGKDIAMSWLESLSTSKLNSQSTMKIAGHQWIKGDVYSTSTITITELMDVFTGAMSDADVSIKEETSVYPVSVLTAIVDALDGNISGEWTTLESRTTSEDDQEDKIICPIPNGDVLYGTLYKEVESMVVATGLLALVVKELNMACLTKNVDGVVLTLKAKIQQRLLGKTYGRQKTIGNYFTMLPGAWLENKYDVCLPGRDHYVISDEDFVPGNAAKMPTLFIGAISGVHVYKDIMVGDNITRMNAEMRALLSCVVFVHPDMFLEQQNDADGDLLRVSFESYHLPLYGTVSPLAQFNNAFHLGYIRKESNPVLKGTKTVVSTFKQLHTSIKDAALAKTLVGSFTNTLFHYASAISNDTECKNEQFKRDIIVLLGEFVQTEAMNNIKQGQGSGYVSDLIAPHVFKNAKYLDSSIKKAVKALSQYMVSNGHAKSFDWCVDVVNYLAFLANNVDMTSFNLLKDSVYSTNVEASLCDEVSFDAFGIKLKVTSDMNYEIFLATERAQFTTVVNEVTA